MLRCGVYGDSGCGIVGVCGIHAFSTHVTMTEHSRVSMSWSRICLPRILLYMYLGYFCICT